MTSPSCCVCELGRCIEPEYCEERGCAYCVFGCPSPYGEPCCLGDDAPVIELADPDLAALRARDVAAGAHQCRECSCTDNYGCAGGCWWVERYLCSACAGDGTLFDLLLDDDEEDSDLVLIENVDAGGFL